MALLMNLKRVEGDETLVAHCAVIHNLLLRVVFTDMSAIQVENKH
jgi:hypothetical protein